MPCWTSRDQWDLRGAEQPRSTRPRPASRAAGSEEPRSPDGLGRGAVGSADCARSEGGAVLCGGGSLVRTVGGPGGGADITYSETDGYGVGI